MGKSKSYKDRFSSKKRDEIVYVALDEIHVTDSTWRKLMARDHGQIEIMREDYENGRDMIRVVLRPRVDGGYNIEDGRHRVIAAKLARIGFIEAVLIGNR